MRVLYLVVFFTLLSPIYAKKKLNDFRIYRESVSIDMKKNLLEGECYAKEHAAGTSVILQKTDCNGLPTGEFVLIERNELKGAMIPYGDARIKTDLQTMEGLVLKKGECLRTVKINSDLNTFFVKKTDCKGTIIDDREYRTSVTYFNRGVHKIEKNLENDRLELKVFNPLGKDFDGDICIEIVADFKAGTEEGKHFRRTNCNGKRIDKDDDKIYYLKNTKLMKMIVPNYEAKVVRSLQTLDGPGLSKKECTKVVGVNGAFNYFTFVKTDCKGNALDNKTYQTSISWFKKGISLTGKRLTEKEFKSLKIISKEETNEEMQEQPVADHQVYTFGENEYPYKQVIGKKIYSMPEKTTLYKESGVHWRECLETKGKLTEIQKKKCGVVWPSINSSLEVVEEKFLEVKDPRDELFKMRRFFKVKYRNIQGEVITGWINSDFTGIEPVEIKKRVPIKVLASNLKKKKLKFCPIPGSIDLGNNELFNLGEELNLSRMIDEVVKEIKTPKSGKQFVGACHYNRKKLKKFIKPKSKKMKKKNRYKTVYDKFVGDAWDSKAIPKIPYTRIETDEGRIKTVDSSVSRKDLTAIDALSRTIYGEMASCHALGRGYFFGVGAVVYNRARATEHKSQFFAHKRSDRDPITQVVIKRKQFTVWNKTYEGKINHGLKQVLCPPSDVDKLMWTGAKPPGREIKIWNDALRVATMAVLYPDQFCKYTKSIKNFYYTSAISRSNNFSELSDPTVDGMKLSRNRCLRFWDVNPSRKKSAASVEDNFKKKIKCK